MVSKLLMSWYRIAGLSIGDPREFCALFSSLSSLIFFLSLFTTPSPQKENSQQIQHSVYLFLFLLGTWTPWISIPTLYHLLREKYRIIYVYIYIFHLLEQWKSSWIQGGSVNFENIFMLNWRAEKYNWNILLKINESKKRIYFEMTAGSLMDVLLDLVMGV